MDVPLSRRLAPHALHLELAKRAPGLVGHAFVVGPHVPIGDIRCFRVGAHSRPPIAVSTSVAADTCSMSLPTSWMNPLAYMTKMSPPTTITDVALNTSATAALAMLVTAMLPPTWTE